MPSAVVTFPDGRKAKISGPTKEAVLTTVQKMSSMGVDPNTGNVDPDLAELDAAMAGIGRPASEAAAPVSLPFGMGEFSVGGPAAEVVRNVSSVEDETAFPLVGATLATAAAPALAGGAAAARGLPLAARLATRAAQKVLPAPTAAAAGGAAGGAAVESENPDATAESIAMAALESGGEMALAELLGMGLGAATTRAIAPNLKFLDPLKSVREEVAKHTGQILEGRTAQQISEAWKKLSKSQQAKVPKETREVVEGLSTVNQQIKRLGKFISSPIGGEIAESLTVPVVAMMFGPGTALSLSIGKALLNPGPAARYLANDKLPPEAVRAVAGQATRLGAREQLAEED